MLGPSANPGLPQPVEEVAYAGETAVFNPIFAPNQALHVHRTPSPHAVFANLGWYADARLERGPLLLVQLGRTPRTLPILKPRDALLIVPPDPVPEVFPTYPILLTHPLPGPPQHYIPYRQQPLRGAHAPAATAGHQQSLRRVMRYQCFHMLPPSSAGYELITSISNCHKICWLWYKVSPSISVAGRS